MSVNPAAEGSPMRYELYYWPRFRDAANMSASRWRTPVPTTLTSRACAAWGR